MIEERSRGGSDPSGLVGSVETVGSRIPSGKPQRKRLGRRSAPGAELTASSAEARSGTKVHPKSLVARVRRFLGQVIAELRKVIWPNRTEMVTYTSVVLAFVVFMVTVIGVLDLAVIKGVTWLFG